jgi:hypothetical protein
VTAATSQQARLAPVRVWSTPFAFAAVFAGLLCGKRKTKQQMVLAVLAVFLIFGIIACGGNGIISPTSQPSQPGSPTSATLTVMGTSGGQSATATLTLNITH